MRKVEEIRRKRRERESFESPKTSGEIQTREIFECAILNWKRAKGTALGLLFN